MRSLVEMLIFILFHNVSSKFFNDQHFYSPHTVVLQFYIVLSALYKNLPIKSVGSGPQNRVGQVSGNSTFFFLA